jgi:membrane protease YdiL (CAAX protease family)
MAGLAGDDGGPDAGDPRPNRQVHHAASWRWIRWTRWPLNRWILAVALATVTVDVVTAWLNVDMGHMGRVPISPALPLGLLLAAMVGFRRLGADRANGYAWHEFLVGSGIALLFGVIIYSIQIHGSAEAFGLVVAALGEELVYRLAVLIIVGVCCAAAMGRNWRNAEDWGTGPGVVAIAAAGVVFAFLPGHVAQMSDTLHAIPFVSLGIVLGYVVLRTGALLPAAVVHALLNLATIAADTGHAPVILRTALSAAALLALLAGTVVAGWRLGILRKIEPAAGPGLARDRTVAAT